MKSYLSKLLSVTLITLSLLTAGCGSDSGTPVIVTPTQSKDVSIGPGYTLAKSDFLSKVTAQIVVMQAANPQGDWTKFLNYFGDIVSHAAYDIELHQMSYLSKRADGSTVKLSGLIMLPRAANGTKPAVPIMMYQHATEPYPINAPSEFLTFGRNPINYPEVIIAAAMAMTGYAIALPDYQGLGINTDVQPFVHAKTLAVQVIDMLRATRDTIKGTTGGITAPCAWNDKLFLMGYSAGGYATMATARELQLNNSTEFKVTATAAMSGPHDLSGTMRNVMLADTTFKAPYFAPLVLTSYYDIYKDSKLSPAYTLIPPFSTTLPLLLKGNSTGETINMAMGMSYNPVNLIVVKDLFTEQFIADLQSTSSSIYGYLLQNDTYRGWVPNTPLRMFHNPADELVPYANSQVAFDSFSNAGAGQLVTLTPSTDTVYITDSTVPSVHVAAAVPELHAAWSWFAGFGR